MEVLIRGQSSPRELKGHNIPVVPSASGHPTGDPQPWNEGSGELL